MAKKHDASKKTAKKQPDQKLWAEYKSRIETLRPVVRWLCEDVIEHMGLNVKLYRSFEEAESFVAAGNFYMAELLMATVGRIVNETAPQHICELANPLKGTFATEAEAHLQKMYTVLEIAQAYTAISNLCNQQEEKIRKDADDLQAKRDRRRIARNLRHAQRNMSLATA